MQRRKQAILAVGAGTAVLFLAFLATLALRPSLLIGVEGDALAHSVDSRLPAIGPPGRCERSPDDAWICHVLFEDDPGSGGGYVVYRVTADRLGCWHAVRPRGARSGDRLPAETHGCIYLWDF